VYDQVKKMGLEVEYLINNAGFGGHGSIVDRSLQDDLNMIQVNVSSVVALTHLFAADMVASGRGGKILNVGSIAGFMPGPYQAVYFASKAFLSSFSQAVDQELRGKGVTCTVLAPGVTDTEFFAVANLEGAKMTKDPTMSAELVAEIGYKAMMDGTLVATCDSKATLLSWLTALLPRRFLLQIGEDIHRKETPPS
jgi:short-subunit dehydrogenase